MLTRAIDRGHLDNRAPAFRIVLHAQPSPRVQANLFAAGEVEPNTEPPCDHPEAGWQKDLFGDCVYCCTFCGAELPEPKSVEAPRGIWGSFGEGLCGGCGRVDALRRRLAEDHSGPTGPALCADCLVNGLP